MTVSQMRAPVPPKPEPVPDVPSPAFEAEAKAVETGKYGSITVGDRDFEVLRRPNPFLLEKMASMDENDPKSLSILVSLFSQTLGKEAFAELEEYTMTLDWGVEDFAAAARDLAERAVGRPTE